MTDATRAQIGSILTMSFGAIQGALRQRISSVNMTTGHSQSEAFLFRAYAEYCVGGLVIVISFDVQRKGNRLRICGDISRENGVVLKELMQISMTIGDEGSDVDNVIGHAREFAAQCEREVDLLGRELSQR